ncbi:hypothetical protein ACFOWB_25355 [Chenggangzhangella methanolivorans]|uniref:hypothetical protein n=1 Tax=Chenggangzhangella methanolivorans TaxID=1437009 RepID=UPI00361EE502
MAPWEPFGSSFKAEDDLNWPVLSQVYHTTHRLSATRIIEDGRVKRGLVYDESELNKTRTTVSWVSPNHWRDGYRYGSVRFGFNWSLFADQSHFYWVECIEYSPPACRFLITERDLSSELPALTRYDPMSHLGPLLFDGVDWRRNRAIALELMIDDDIALSHCTGIDLVTHHPQQCNERNPNCPERRNGEHDTGARLVAALLGRELTNANHCLKSDEPESIGLTVQGALGLLSLKLRPKDGEKGVISDIDHAQAIVTAAFNQYGSDHIESAKTLCRTLQDGALFDEAMKRIVRRHFHLPHFNF